MENQREKNQKKLKIVAIVGASDFNKEHFVKNFKKNIFCSVIAADYGYKHLEEIDIVPNVAIGDFDSLGYVPKENKVASVQIQENIKHNIIEPIRVMEYPADKDKSDLELAINEALETKPNLIMIYGALGNRLDFSFSTIQMLSHCTDYNVGVFAVGQKYSCFALKGNTGFGLKVPKDVKNRKVSIFSLSDVALIEKSVGLRWNYNNTPLTSAMSLGVSNEVVAEEFSLKVQQGKVLIVFDTDLV